MKSSQKGAQRRGAATKNAVGKRVAGVDAIEIKATVPDHQIDIALTRYGLTVDNDEERYIYFFDTPGLDLARAGVVARARRIVGGQHDSTVKFRPVTPAEVSKDWAKLEGFKLEADASEKGIVKSASLTMPVAKGLIKKVVAGEEKIGQLFTKEQRKFLQTVGGQEIDFDSLACLGPLEAHRWKFEDLGCPWRITAELWKRPDGKRLMEVSIKCPAAHAAVAIAGFMAFLAEVGAEQDTEQQSKTRWSLDHYAAAAKAAAKAGAKAGAPEQAPVAKA